MIRMMCIYEPSVKGCIHRALEALPWLSMSIYIDVSKVFVNLWVHLSFAIFAIFDLKRQLK